MDSGGPSGLLECLTEAEKNFCAEAYRKYCRGSFCRPVKIGNGMFREERSTLSRG